MPAEAKSTGGQAQVGVGISSLIGLIRIGTRLGNRLKLLTLRYGRRIRKSPLQYPAEIEELGVRDAMRINTMPQQLSGSLVHERVETRLREICAEIVACLALHDG
jgi:hypothetical protein